MEAPLRRSTVVLAVVLAFAPSAVGAQEVDRAGESAMLARINAMRAAQQLAPLTRHEGLDAAARVHSMDMAANRMLAHVSPRTGNPSDRMRAASVDAQRIAENIARRESTLEAHQSILESEAHRAQLLDPQMTHIGLSAVVGSDGVYVTQLIARIESELPPDPAAALPPPAVEEVAPPAAAPAEPAVDAPADGEDPIAALAAQALAAAELQASDVDPEPAIQPEPQPTPEVVYDASPPPPRPPAATVVAPTLRVPSNHRGVAGYWVRHGGRWWYFPVPAAAVPGQVLSPDPSVVGPPPQGGQQLRARPVTAAPPPRTTAPAHVYVQRSTGAGPAYYYTPTTHYISR